jgi:hypothetical protein
MYPATDAGWEKVAAAPKSEGAANQAHGNDTRFSMHLLQVMNQWE